MKKILIILGSIAIIGTIAYKAIPSYSKSSTVYNNDEYYYNDDSNSDKDDKNMGSINTNEITEKASTIDTNPSSITVLVNSEYSLPSDYIPDDLVEPNVLFSINYDDDKKKLRKVAALALEDLFNTAKKEGLIFYGVSGYRSYARQKEIYDNNIITKGLEHTRQYSAKPGSSEHQTGLAIDISTISVNNRIDEGFAATPESKWLEKNCYKFGFIIRYPKDKSEITGIAYEPWHIRYVGKPLAKFLYENKLTLEEYYNYKPSNKITDDDDFGTLNDVEDEDYNDTKPSTKPSVKPSMTPSTKPSPTASVTPSVSPTPSVSQVPGGKNNTSATKKPVPTKKPTATPVPATKEPEVEPTKKPTQTVTPTVTESPSAAPATQTTNGEESSAE